MRARKEKGLTAGNEKTEGPPLKRPIRTPQSRGAFPPAVEGEGFVFLSAAGGTDDSGELVGPDVAEQAARCVENLARLLSAAGGGLQHVVKCTVFLTDIRDAAAVDAVLEGRFRVDLPARTCVEVRALPDGQRVAIEAIAVRPQEARTVIDFMG